MGKLFMALYRLAVVFYCALSVLPSALPEGFMQPEPKVAVDAQFSESMSLGINNRTALLYEDSMKDELTKGDYAEQFNAEYAQIAQYKDCYFENSELGNLAEEYIACIEDSIACLEFFGTEMWENEYEYGADDERLKLMYKINRISPIITSDEYMEYTQYCIDTGEVLIFAQDLFGSVYFQRDMDSEGGKTYYAVVKNTTSIDFTYFQFNVSSYEDFYNTEPISEEIASVDSWKSGEEKKFSFKVETIGVRTNVDSVGWKF